MNISLRKRKRSTATRLASQAQLCPRGRGKSIVLDAEGERNVKAIAERATKEVENEQRATAKRIEKANGDGGKATGYTFALLAFEAAWEPADLHALIAQRIERAASVSANGANGAGRNGGGSKRGGRRKAGVAGK
jgi:hypothetical protein